MKKIVSFALVLVMLASMLVISANAKDPYGTVLEAQYTKTAPDMSEKLPDDSWGKAVAHIDKNSPNAGVTQYSSIHYKDDPSPYKIDESISFDAYMRWTDKSLYLCFTAVDKEYCHADGFQFDIVYGITDISHYSAQFCSTKEEALNFTTYGFTVYDDDYTGVPQYTAEVLDMNFALFFDEKTQKMVLKVEFPFTTIGLSKKDAAKDGDIISFVMICTDSVPDDYPRTTGWLEWGDFYNKEKGVDVGPDPTTIELYYNAASLNKKTTSANSIKLVGKNSGTTPVTPTPKEEPSSWAKAEVDKAIAAGLVPENLQKDYTKGISRENLAKILSKLLDKVYGKAPTKTDAKFKDTSDADVLKAANLGIINGYDAGNGEFNFKPANTLKRSEMSAIVNRVAKLCGKTTTGFDKEVKFADTANHWCKSELGWPVHVGIVKGTSDTTFSPENTLTTEQTIMMIYRAYEALK